MYILSASVSFLHLTSTAQAQEGERPCQSGPNPAPECSTAPCQPSLWPPVCPQPQRPGVQQAESRSWVCLILIIGFNFSFASFSSGPCGSPGLGKRTDLCSYFHTFPVQSGVGALHPYPNHPSPPSCWVSVSACFLCCGGRLFEPLLPPWFPGVRNGGGICLKRHFIIIKSIFTKPMLGFHKTWGKGLKGWVLLGF